MVHEIVPPPVYAPPAQVFAAAAEEVPGETVVAPTAEQVHAADQVFAANEESQQVAALFGLYGGVVLGHQLLTEVLEQRQDEAEPKKRDVPDLA